MRTIHLADADGRDSHVVFVAVRPPPPPRRATRDGTPVRQRRFVAATEATTHEALVRAYGDDYGAHLLRGDPEVDVELTGRPVERTSNVWIDGGGDVLRASPRIVELLLAPDGHERARRDPVDVPSNIADAAPVRFGRTRLPRAEAVRRFVFGRTVQLCHVDGLTYEYLHGLAKRLHDADELVVLGAGAGGREPLVFQLNGTPWRGFLEGRVDGARYALLLRLSNLELKLPEAT